MRRKSPNTRTGVIVHSGMSIAVRILEVKQAYGRTRHLVTPVAGSGTMWTEQVTFDEPKADAEQIERLLRKAKREGGEP